MGKPSEIKYDVKTGYPKMGTGAPLTPLPIVVAQVKIQPMTFPARSIQLTVVLFVTFSGTTATGKLRSQPVFQYGPHAATATGIIGSRVYPGPPNYESVRKGDEAEGIWFVRLARPITVAENADYEKETGVEEIQLAVDNSRHFKLLKRRVGKSIIASGPLFHAHTGHHHLPVLMEIQSLKVPK